MYFKNKLKIEFKKKLQFNMFLNDFFKFFNRSYSTCKNIIFRRIFILPLLYGINIHRLNEFNKNHQNKRLSYEES